MDNNIDRMNNQNAKISESNMETEPRKHNILLGSLGALIATIIGAIVWIILAAFTGKIFFFLGAGIVFFAMFLYEKLSKKMDIIGMIICLALTCIAIYFCIRYGYICALANEYECSFKKATTIFETNYSFNKAFVNDYIKNMILSYAVSIGYTVAMIFMHLKKR